MVWSLPPSELPPLALALADVLLVCLLVAVTFNAPVTASERASSALVVSATPAKESANPKLKLLPWAAPAAEVVAVPVWLAATDALCSVSVAPPELIAALVL